MQPRRRVRTGIALAALAAGIAGCDGSDGAAPTAMVYATYVLFAPAADEIGTIAVARAIIAPGQSDCPTLEGERESIRMHFRRNPHRFPVDVCEGRVPFDQALRLSWNGQSLPVVRSNPSRLLVLGDTGCKSANCAASDPAAPFAAIADAAAAIAPVPHLLVHVGDYNYRGTPGTVKVKGSDASLTVYDAGDTAPDDPECQLTSPYVSQNADYSEEPDNWDAWWHDFFEPAAPLLARAPWVFVRGNHELCSRAGPGWLYFLDAGALAEVGGTGQLDCPFQGGAQPPMDRVLDHLRFAPPYTLDLGTLRLAVVDSANACDAFAPEATTQIYTDQLRQVLEAVEPGVPTWVATHRPFWAATSAITSSPTTPPAYASIDRTLQEALARAAAGGPGVLPDEIQLMLAGHIHALQSATFFDEGGLPRPPQLVVGNSGVALDEHAVTGAFDATVDDFTAHILGLEEFGYLEVADLQADGSWRGAFHSGSNTPFVDCETSFLPGSLCVMVP